jgi:hypothetical protein
MTLIPSNGFDMGCDFVSSLIEFALPLSQKNSICKRKNGTKVDVSRAFEFLSHGTIAFGFFNIETDLLLLESLFFFAPDFCEAVGPLTQMQTHESTRAHLPGYCIDRPGDVGNLMGAIRGTDLGGFIGHVYRLYPFPQDPEDFKQKPYGNVHRAAVEAILTQWSHSIRIPIAWDVGQQKVRIADFTFGTAVFRELVAYVWQGGMAALFADLTLEGPRGQGIPEEPGEVPKR